MAKIKKKIRSNAAKDTEHLNFSYIAGGILKWYDQLRKQFGGFASEIYMLLFQLHVNI